MAPYPVSAPAVEEYPHGIVHSGTPRTTADNRWENGVVFDSALHLIINGMCFECSEPMTKSADQTCEEGVTFLPYLLEFGVVQQAPDTTYEGLEEQVRRLMRVGTSARLEDMMTVGCTGNDNPTLSDGVSLGSGHEEQAVGLVISSFYDADSHIGARGTIYMSPSSAASVVELLEEDREGILRTIIGKHKVIVGNFPDDVIYGHVGDVDVYLSEVFLTNDKNAVMSTNTLNFRVERLAMAVFDTETLVQATITYDEGTP